MIIKCDKECFNKLESSNTHNDKIDESTDDNVTRDSMFKGEPTTEDLDDEDACQFLLLLKTQNSLMVDKEDEMKEIEWRIV